ncbi:hypothetical protein QYF36_022705 [Acer negundo]|nr:hypothetical protein QYF36_022705 [Acer negundo]
MVRFLNQILKSYSNKERIPDFDLLRKQLDSDSSSVLQCLNQMKFCEMKEILIILGLIKKLKNKFHIGLIRTKIVVSQILFR